MNAKSKNIAIIAALGLIAVVATAGFLTDWFGLYRQNENKIIIVGDSESLVELANNEIDGYLSVDSTVNIEALSSTNVVTAVGSGQATLGLTTTPLSSENYNSYPNINQYVVALTESTENVYMIFNGYPNQNTYNFVRFMMGTVGKGIVYASGFNNITTYSGANTLITIRGSTTVFPIMAAAAEIYQMFHPEVSIAVSGTGSTDGKSAINGSAPTYVPQVTFGMSSSQISTASYPNVINVTVAMDAVCVIVNKKMTTVTDLTILQIRGIFNGTYTNWNQIGGPNKPINVYVRESGSGTRDSFNHFTGVTTYVSTATALASNGAIHDSVEEDENAIGYVGIGYVDAGVKALSVNGIVPTSETTLDKSYPMSREIFLLERIDSPYVPEGSALELKNMILTTQLGAWIIKYTGFVPLV